MSLVVPDRRCRSGRDARSSWGRSAPPADCVLVEHDDGDAAGERVDRVACRAPSRSDLRYSRASSRTRSSVAAARPRLRNGPSARTRSPRSVVLDGYAHGLPLVSHIPNPLAPSVRPAFELQLSGKARTRDRRGRRAVPHRGRSTRRTPRAAALRSPRQRPPRSAADAVPCHAAGLHGAAGWPPPQPATPLF